jgi:hypothetical protein
MDRASLLVVQTLVKAQSMVVLAAQMVLLLVVHLCVLACSLVVQHM